MPRTRGQRGPGPAPDRRRGVRAEPGRRRTTCASPPPLGRMMTDRGRGRRPVRRGPGRSSWSGGGPPDQRTTVMTRPARVPSYGGPAASTGSPASPGRGSHPTARPGVLLTLHQEGVGREHRAVAHRHAVEDHGADPDGAAGADRDAVGLEGVVLLGVALDPGPGVEADVVADRHQVLLRQVAAVVEEPLAEPDTQHPQDHALERRAVEHCPDAGLQLEEALGPPEVDVVDRAVLRFQGPEPGGGPLDQHAVGDAEQEGEDRARRDRRHAEGG